MPISDTKCQVVLAIILILRMSVSEHNGLTDRPALAILAVVRPLAEVAESADALA